MYASWFIANGRKVPDQIMLDGYVLVNKSYIDPAAPLSEMDNSNVSVAQWSSAIDPATTMMVSMSIQAQSNHVAT